MPRQHEPPAGETTPSVAVRRAVSVPPPGEDPGAGLGPRTPDPGPDPAAPIPIPASPAPAPRRLFGRRSASATAEPASAAQGHQPEPEQRQRQAAASDGPEPDASAGVLFAGGDDGPDDPDAAGASPGRPRGPMLAAAAIAGAVLISVPFLVLGLSDDDGNRTVNTAPVAGTTLDAGLSDDKPAATYAAESPSPSASVSPSPSRSASPSASPAEVKAAPRPVVKERAVVRPTAKPQTGTKVKKAPAPTTRQLVNALSNRVNVLLLNVATGRCADIPGEGHGSVDGAVNQHSCITNSADNMLWDLKVTDPDGGPGGASLFVVTNRKDGLCLDLPYYGSVSPQTKVSEYYCDGTNADNQQWWLDPRPQGYWIRNIASNLCMSVTGGKNGGEDARLYVVKCGDNQLSAQRWMISQLVKP
ncbi:RICIN domain-containing protein [Streptomyces sp. NPDC001508]|uniref:RICIN domain-containing protein n=1 Tax=Streptomyces sp. NPDC001508 TaxID=3154656 RepID=UPI00332C3016